MSQAKKKVGNVCLTVYFRAVLLTLWVVWNHSNRTHLNERTDG